MDDPLLDEARKRGLIPSAQQPDDPLIAEARRRGIVGDSPNDIQRTAQALAPPSIPQKMAYGAMDIWNGMRQAMAHSPPAEDYETMGDTQNRLALGKVMGPAVDKELAKREQDWQALRELNKDKGIEFARGAGNALAATPIALLASQGGAGIPGAVVGGAMQGGITAALNPVTSGDYNSGKTKQIGVGTAAGVGTGLLTGMAREVLSPTPKDPEVQGLIDQGARPTFGQSIGPKAANFEDKLTSVPGLGDLIKDSQRKGVESFNQALYNKALAPLGEKYEGQVGHAGVRKVGDVLSDAYDSIVPELKLSPNEALAADISDAVSIRNRMTKSAAKQLDGILKDILPTGKVVEGEGLKDLQSQLSYEISRFGKSTSPSDQMISDALDGVQAAIMKNLAETNPDHAAQLKAIDTGWATLVRIERAAANSKNGVFTPDAFLSAVKATDDSVRKRAYARGTAFLQDFGEQAANVMGNRYPDSGSPGRLLASGAALGYINPKSLALGAAASVPYLPGIRNGALTTGARPVWASQAANALRLGAPAITSGLIFGGRPQ